ncbi:MAG: thiopurine S-methyltransferase [Planctomycetes bacterium]|nr:thiopurine S-methyltransferase [Planctomycetota bacterium]
MKARLALMMQQDFWTDRWAEGKTGWHAAQPNAFLLAHLDHLQCQLNDAVLVPLSGKSLDLIWLRREAGLRAIGVEWAEKAVADTFIEADLIPERRVLADAVELWFADGVAVLCADWFTVTREHLAYATECAGAGRPLQAWWDRAALIALSPEIRPRYAAHMLELLPSAARGLLLTVEYPEEQLSGPPFNVEPIEVHHHFGTACEVSESALENALVSSLKRQAQGVTRFDERLYSLVKR